MVYEFKIGDIVRLKNGNAHLRVSHVDSDRGVISAQYLKAACSRYSGSSSSWQYDRRASDFRLVDRKEEEINTENKGNIEMALFTANDKYYTYLATDSKGKFVLEEKETGLVVALEPDSVSEVFPYTVRVKAPGGTVNIVSKEGVLEVNDVLLLSGSLSIVLAIDTKHKGASAMPKHAKKIMTIDL